MTVVVMGFCHDGSEVRPSSPIGASYLIATCDTMLSSDDATILDSGVCKVQKAGFLGPWLIGYTGDPELFLPLKFRLATKFREVDGNLNISEDQLLYTLRDVYTAYREDKIADQILRPNWHIESIAELRGMEHTHPKTYKKLWAQVEAFDLGIDVCLGGFSEKAGTQLRGVYNPGCITENRAPVNPGVIAIGSGFRHAASHLRAWYDKFGPLKEAIYYMLEAKIVGDMDVPTVGAETDLIILANIPRAEPQITSHRVRRENVQKFRETWIAERRAPSKSLIKMLDIEPLWNY